MNARAEHPFKARVEKMLEKFGGFYLFEDIIDAVYSGHMQSFTLGESWAVTRVCEFPRKSVLEIVLCVGNLNELELIHTDIIGWARDHGCSYAMANARLGFDEYKLPGWNKISATYVKDLSDGS